MTGTRHRAWLWVLAALLAALALRVPRLNVRPMHGDEANQAVRTGLLLDKGVYHYDPRDHHGPVLYFAALPFCRATASRFADTTEWNYRLVPVVFSCLTLLLMAGLGVRRDGGLFPNRAGLFAALLLTAVSPPMVYYGRFFIQESMFVTFLTGMLVSAVHYTRAEGSAGRCAWAASFGLFTGLAVATKETVVLSLAAAGVAIVAACGWRRVWRAACSRDALWALGTAAFVAVLLYSSFFTYPQGVYDAVVKTFAAYKERAMDVPEHQHPWNFYLKLLFWFKYGRGPVWSEAALLAPGLLAALAALLPAPSAEAEGRHHRYVRFAVVYTLSLTALYAAVPYKTPWCVLSFLHGFILLAGIGFGIVWERVDALTSAPRSLGVLVLAALLGGAVWRDVDQSLRACFKYPADPRNPYVYAHTGTDALNLVAAIDEAARAADGYDTFIALAVPTPDTWPLPWYLRKYTNVGYWNRVAEIPDSLRPTIVVAAADQGDVADARFGAGKRASFFGIRPGVLLNVFVPVREPGGK